MSGAGRAGGPGTPIGAALGDDFTEWHYWWELNKDSFINLKEAVHSAGTVTHSDQFFMGAGLAEGRDSLRPGRAEIERDVLPALRRALEATDDRDIVTACLVALAKVGRDHPDFELLPLFAARLRSRDQEVRETAALAIGISQLADGMPPLRDLLLDTAQGRRRQDRGEVDDRSRSFAAYGLGLIAHGTRDADVKRGAFEALREVLADRSLPSRNVRVAVIHGISLMNLEDDSSKHKRLLAECLASLDRYLDLDLGIGDQLIQAHVPTAIAKLLGGRPDDSRTDYYRRRFLKLLNDHSLNDAMTQSAVLALGSMARPFEDDASADRKISESLLRVYRRGSDKQTSYFALIALGRIGGANNRAALLEELARGNKATERPWAAIALGLLGRAQPAPDPAIGTALRHQLRAARNPQTAAAMAVALGLSRDPDSADAMLAMLARERNKDELAGYLCVGLALLEERRAVPAIRAVVDGAVRRPELLRQAAMALGKLGDKSASESLLQLLRNGQRNVARTSAVAMAVGLIGDRRTLGPLIELLFDDSMTDLSRAFAAVALGSVCDKELLPWHAKIASRINYRASVETLTNGHSGILDIL